MTTTNHVFLSDALKRLTTWAAQHVTSSSAFPTYSFQEPDVVVIAKAIRQIEELVGIPKREVADDFFIKAIANEKNVFTRLSYPDLALAMFEGKLQPCFIWHNVVVSAQNLFVKHNKTIQFHITGDPNEPKKTMYALSIIHPNNEETGEFKLRVWTKQQDQNETYVGVKLKLGYGTESGKYLYDALAQYVFPLSWLKDGRYEVSSFTKRGETNHICTIDGNLYYLSETKFKQLEENKSKNKPCEIIIDGTRQYTKNQVTFNFRNIYVNGFPPPTKLRAAITEICAQNEITGFHANTEANKAKNDKELTVARITELVDGITFKPEIVFKVKNLELVNSNKGNPSGILLVVSYGGREFNLLPNTTIRGAYGTGMLDLENFEGVEFCVTGVGKYGEHLTFPSYFKIPDQCKRSMSAFNNLANVLNLPVA